MANRKVKVHLPNIEKGVDVQILHLGVFKNGYTHNVTDEQVQVWEEAHFRDWPDSGTLDVGKPLEPLPTEEPEETPVVIENNVAVPVAVEDKEAE